MRFVPIKTDDPLNLHRFSVRDLELQMEEMNDAVKRIASSDAACRRLRSHSGLASIATRPPVLQG